ncbi:MAG: GLPGLI family protein [Sphingobacteriales bacterium]|nr:MAG: GLPGLI family protein [Sphingobacteriales bacterium]
MKYLLGLLLACSLNTAVQAQHLMGGKITFERKTNIHQAYEGSEWFEDAKADIPKMVSNNFTLTFDTARSLYEPVPAAEDEKQKWYTPPGAENRVVQSFASGTVAAQKQIFEQVFRIEDSMPRHTWKISSEVRTIAGYACRKAVTRICDSVYVVAFYADEIPVSGGPEQFGGLPGMILQLVVPRLGTTWQATSIQELRPDEALMKLPASKSKPTTRAGLATTIQSSLKDWGKWGSRAVWWSVL